MLPSAAGDQQGNVFFTGVFSGPTVTFGDQSLTNLSLYPGGPGRGSDNLNGFIAKYTSSGQLLWIQHIGGEQEDQVDSCAADAAGNVFVTGWLGSTNVWFGTNLVVNAGGSAFFLAKFDPQGDLIWVRLAQGLVGYTSVALDAAGNIHVAGTLGTGSATFGTNVLSNPYNSTAPHPYPGAFVAEYSGAGEVIWAKAVSFNGYDYGSVFAADAQGNSYLSDCFPGMATFGSLALTNSTGGGGSTLFLAKYDSAGNLGWAIPIATSFSAFYARALAVGPQGDCHLLGRYGPDATFGAVSLPTSPNQGNGFIAKYDATGTLTWVNPILVNPSSGSVVGSSLMIDAMDSCWAVGWALSSSLTFGVITATNSDPSYTHGFVARYQPGGSALWAKILDSPGAGTFPFGVLDSTGSLSLYGLAVGTNTLNLDGNVLNGSADGLNYFFAAKINGPVLSVQSLGTQIVISWPTNAFGLSLETCTGFSAGNWSPVTNAPAVVGVQYSITNDVAPGSRFYRLRNF